MTIKHGFLTLGSLNKSNLESVQGTSQGTSDEPGGVRSTVGEFGLPSCASCGSLSLSGRCEESVGTPGDVSVAVKFGPVTNFGKIKLGKSSMLTSEDALIPGWGTILGLSDVICELR